METEKQPTFKHKKYARQIMNQLSGISYVAKIIQQKSKGEYPNNVQSAKDQEAGKLIKDLYKNAQRGYGIITGEKHLPITMRKLAVIFKVGIDFKRQVTWYLLSRGINDEYVQVFLNIE